ncbi:MAG: DUF4442 domain-containing protein [Sphingobacteriales bacterium]|nr:DUF4442 domain-containing protein [Sphingobacteriales bacterium]
MLLEVNPNAEAFKKKITRTVTYKLFLLTQLPMAFLAGLRVEQFDEMQTVVTVPYKFLNKNPFQSVYFAVLAMAAELSTGIPAFAAVYNNPKPASMLVTGMSAQFSKKAKGVIRFTCRDSHKIWHAIATAQQHGNWEAVRVATIGIDAQGEEVAHFEFEWSFRSRIMDAK